MNTPKIVEIKEIINETATIKTFIFDWKVKEELPGQFMMLWNFNDEKPMSLSLINSKQNEIGISIRKVGKFTEAVHLMEERDKLGLRGPYGRGFQIAGSQILVVGGGIGMAPLITFAETAAAKGVQIDVINAATTKNELPFLDRLKKIDAGLKPCTDDGTYGFCGFGTELARQALENERYDMLVSCGPEVMMKKLADIVDEFRIPAQFSLERYMKCGIGICGQCCVDNVGWRICMEGPVFWRDELRLISEFGQYYRDASGMKHSF